MKTLFVIPLLLMSVLVQGQKNKQNKVVLPKVVVVDTPVIEWISYPKDSAVVAFNIQTVTCQIKSRLPLKKIEIKVNGLTTDVYNVADFSSAIGQNKYLQLIERTVTLRTGANVILIIAQNDKSIFIESQRRIIVDPTQISMVRNTKDQTPPMIYISNPSNIKNDKVTVYDEMVKVTGTVIDESGIQSLTINKTVTPIKPSGDFTIYLPLNMGETAINIEAKDVNQNIALKKFTIDRKNTDGTVYKPEAAKNYLLVIGINNYNTPAWPALNNAVADAEAVRDVLTNQYTFDSLNVTVLLNEQATRANIYEALRMYIEKISSGDNLLIYYSGHGYFDKLLSEGYWVPVDAQGSDVSAFVPNSQILKIIENINSQHTFLVADACYSGSMFAANTRGYSDHVEKYKSRWGLASGRLEKVLDGDVGANSPFAQSFVSFLQNNTDSKVAVSDLVQYVKKKVTELSNQTPMGNPLNGVGDEGGEFVFYRKGQ